MAEMKALIALRRECSGIQGTEITWHHDGKEPRLICYDRPGADGIRIYIHGGHAPVTVPVAKEICYSRKFHDGVLESGGVVVARL